MELYRVRYNTAHVSYLFIRGPCIGGSREKLFFFFFFESLQVCVKQKFLYIHKKDIMAAGSAQHITRPIVLWYKLESRTFGLGIYNADAGGFPLRVMDSVTLSPYSAANIPLGFWAVRPKEAQWNFVISSALPFVFGSVDLVARSHQATLVNNSSSDLTLSRGTLIGHVALEVSSINVIRTLPLFRELN